MIAPILVTGDTGRLGSRVGRHRWAEGARDVVRLLGGYLQARGKYRASGLAGEPDWPVGLRTWEDFLAAPGDRSGPTERPARYGSRQGMAADSHDTFIHRSHSSVATCHSCDKQKIPTGASTHRHTPELGEFQWLPLTSSSPSWPPPG
jgi:hypothetical protein